MKWMVSSATTITNRNSNRDRCFELNATNLATKAEAEIEAKRRNKIERAAGHTNVDWYASEMIDIAAVMKKLPPIEEVTLRVIGENEPLPEGFEEPFGIVK
jgi:hypothetical protein